MAQLQDAVQEFCNEVRALPRSRRGDDAEMAIRQLDWFAPCSHPQQLVNRLARLDDWDDDDDFRMLHPMV
jgi:hypothetical protein